MRGLTPMQQKQRFDKNLRDHGVDTSRTAYVHCIHYQCACCGNHVQEGTFSYLSWTPPDFYLFTPPHWDNVEPEIWPRPMRGRRLCERCADGEGALTRFPNRCPWAASSIAGPEEIADGRGFRHDKTILGDTDLLTNRQAKAKFELEVSRRKLDGNNYWQCACRGHY